VQEFDFRVMEAAGLIVREGIENASPVRGVGALPEPESEAEIVRASRVVEIDKSGKVSKKDLVSIVTERMGARA